MIASSCRSSAVVRALVFLSISAMLLVACTKEDKPTTTSDGGLRDGQVVTDSHAPQADGTTTTDGATAPLEQVTKSLGTSMDGVVELSDGAKLRVPAWAVPLDEKGGGIVLQFSAARHTPTITPPTGETIASADYEFGPGHFTFAQSLELTIPITGTPNAEDVRVYRINPATQALENYSASYDPTTKTATVQTRKLSHWLATTAPSASSKASGAFKITNTSSDSWINVCVVSRQLTYPDQDVAFPSRAISAAPTGTVGWSSTVKWFLPQGTYSLCVESVKAGTVSAAPGTPSHVIVADQQLKSPWTSSDPKTTDLSFGALSNPTAGACSCGEQATKASQIFYNGNVAGVQSQPTAPTVFTTDRCYFISRLVTYHYFNNGKSPGTIALKRGDGTVFGPWQASGTLRSRRRARRLLECLSGVRLAGRHLRVHRFRSGDLVAELRDQWFGNGLGRRPAG